MERDPMVRWLLRAEGVAVFALGAALYAGAGGELLLLIPLLFVPDIFMLGYLGGHGSARSATSSGTASCCLSSWRSLDGGWGSRCCSWLPVSLARTSAWTERLATA